MVEEARCLTCGATFTDPHEAAKHRRETNHTGWEIPPGWMMGLQPWTPQGFWETVDPKPSNG